MSPFELRRTAIGEARQVHADVSYRQRMDGLARGHFDTEEEALDGIEQGPFVIGSDEVMQSFADDLDTAKNFRERGFAQLADQTECRARVGLGLEEV